ncbi:MAG: DUF1902 domain-containing protein [Deltaproteobacteria bacterium]|nr:DUF1902 domain-containing protein [Deltaproteobacteria bacterium]
MPKRYLIRAEWDNEAGVWVATSEEVWGLATEADSIEELVASLGRMLPELLEENRQIQGDDGHPEVLFSIISDHVARASAR